MSKKLNISRRDFVNGFALSLTAGTTLSPLEIFAMDKMATSYGIYPPMLTGMRGSHAGSFEIAHSVARGGASFKKPSTQIDDSYDLVVVGGGVSGLSAAYLYRQRFGREAKILILDNHDDFGGHAKRNEFTVNGKDLISYGGSQSIASPGSWSPVAKKLLKDVAIHTDRFYEYFDREYFKNRKLKRGLYFSRERYGEDQVADNIMRVNLEGNKNEILVTF